MILRQMCSAKIHRLTVTEANLDYEGSITIDQGLLDASGILPYEKVQVVNITNGNRFETYAISGEKGSGVVCLNGGAARKGGAKDLIIVIAYSMIDEGSLASFKPKVVLVDGSNNIKKILK